LSVESSRSAADRSSATASASFFSAREQLADLLAELGQPAGALAEYEASLRSAPARLNSYDGAARAAESVGKKQEAKAFRERLVALCGGTVPARVGATITAAK
jgi:predicted Zn-dependent protease